VRTIPPQVCYLYAVTAWCFCKNGISTWDNTLHRWYPSPTGRSDLLVRRPRAAGRGRL